ncbi:MAG: HD domain-containing protein [Dissulfurimicrobium sp.]|uniref:HD domain-containing protein n=1 Tax=Dissulfurimicrobium sp. TaxID=2022436 RepID=UPI00404B97BD
MDNFRILNRSACLDLLASHNVPVHIIEHSLRVAQVGSFLVTHLKKRGHNIDERLVEAGALLHDITKIEAMERNEDHAETGGRLLFSLGYPAISEIVRQHVHLDSTLDETIRLTPVHIVNYADKRVRHTLIVSIFERFEDLTVRYGTTPERKKKIKMLYEMALILEKRIFDRLDFDPQRLCELNNIGIKSLFRQ